MKLSESNLYYFAVVFLFLFNLSIFLPPFFIHSGNESAGAWLYNFHNYDHQWIYRSECVFRDQAGDLLIQDCIIHGKEGEAEISTLYTTNGKPGYDGIWKKYTQDQIGKNKAERVERNGLVGYKFGNDVRDYAIYLPWMLAMVAYPFVFGKGKTEVPDAIWFFVALIPIGIDGITQLLAGMFDNPGLYWLSSFGLEESTNLIRWITGGIAGIAMGYFFVPVVNRIAWGAKLK